MDLQAWSKPCFCSFFHTFFLPRKNKPCGIKPRFWIISPRSWRSDNSHSVFAAIHGRTAPQKTTTLQRTKQQSLAHGPVPQHLMRLPGVSSKQQPFWGGYWAGRWLGKKRKKRRVSYRYEVLMVTAKLNQHIYIIYIIQLYIQKMAKQYKKSQAFTTPRFLFFVSKLKNGVGKYPGLLWPARYEAKQLKLWNHQRYPEISGICSFSKATIPCQCIFKSPTGNGNHWLLVAKQLNPWGFIDGS